MDATETIQVLLFKWIRHHGRRSLSQIRVACKNLMISFGLERKSYLYYYFYPLLRKGIVEFCGNGFYDVSPPTLIYNKVRDISTIINWPARELETLKRNWKCQMVNEFGITNIFAKPDELQNIYGESFLNIFDGEISYILDYFPSVKAIVKGFEEVGGVGWNNRWNITSRIWTTPIQPHAPGIYRQDTEAMVFAFLDKTKKWYRIPAILKNPEAPYIARFYQASLEKLPVLIYHKSLNELDIKNIGIPILIDRILRIPSLWSSNGVILKDGYTKYSCISPAAFKQLSRILCQQSLTSPKLS